MIYGVTLDNVNRGTIDRVVKGLQGTGAAVRVVFDEHAPASGYIEALRRLRAAGLVVMGELLDSYYVKGYSLDEYTRRADEYADVLGGLVSVWEFGNEINGEWLGNGVASKLSAAYRALKDPRRATAGTQTALTLYFNPKCFERKANEMWSWVNANMAFQGAPDWSQPDHVLVSYYEQDCNRQRFDLTAWHDIFVRLGGFFPKAKLGFGEFGAARKTTITQKLEVFHRYTGMFGPLAATVHNFEGGGFWWYAAQDMFGAKSDPRMLDAFKAYLEA